MLIKAISVPYFIYCSLTYMLFCVPAAVTETGKLLKLLLARPTLCLLRKLFPLLQFTVAIYKPIKCAYIMHILITDKFEICCSGKRTRRKARVLLSLTRIDVFHTLFCSNIFNAGALMSFLISHSKQVIYGPVKFKIPRWDKVYGPQKGIAPFGRNLNHDGVNVGSLNLTI